MNTTTTNRSRPGVWLGLLLGSAGVISALRITEAINSSTGFILFGGSMILLIPFIRAIRENQSCTGSGAAIRYTKRIGISSALYVLGLGAAITLDRKLDLEGAEAYLVALMPVLPIFGMIWAMARYIIEETDEFLRQRAVMASLVGLALLLGLASFWGFLEQFELVPHAFGWWAMPVWAIGMGLGQAWQSLRDRAGDEE